MWSSAGRSRSFQTLGVIYYTFCLIVSNIPSFTECEDLVNVLHWAVQILEYIYNHSLYVWDTAKALFFPWWVDLSTLVPGSALFGAKLPMTLDSLLGSRYTLASKSQCTETADETIVGRNTGGSIQGARRGKSL